MRALAEWPLSQRAGICAVLTDIDDTLTTEGRLTPAVMAALAQLRAQDFLLVAVTGRPTWWALPLLRLCGLHAVIAENGASAFWLDQDGRQQSLFYADAETRRTDRIALEQLAHEVAQRFPGIAVADDAPMRVGDLAFDIGETRAPLEPDQVAALLTFFRERGFFSTASSIHAHASLVPFSKQSTCARVLEHVFGMTDAQARQHCVFIGDSGNDASMFSHYPHSIGVANVEPWLDRLPTPPAYVALAARGGGFVEVAQALLAARKA